MKFPTTTGSSRVGSVFGKLTDPTRRSHALSKQDGRVVFFKIWYPAKPSRSTTPTERLWDQLRNDKSVPAAMRLFLPFIFSNRTNAVSQLPISSEHAGSVIIYNHGMISFASENTFLGEELASHGHIVVAIQHEEQSLEFQQLSQKLSPEAKKIQGELQAQIQKNIGSKRAKLSRTYYAAAVTTNQVVAERAKDSVFAMDNIETILGSIPGISPHNLKPKKFGLLGLSLGGAVSTSVAKTDSRCEFSINLDGGIYGPDQDKPINFPYLMLYSSDNADINEKSLDDQGTGLIETDTLPGTKHLNFHEISMIFPWLRFLGMLGSAKPREAISSRNARILAFVGKYSSS